MPDLVKLSGHERWAVEKDTLPLTLNKSSFSNKIDYLG